MDEITIGEDLQAVRSGSYMRLIGFVDQGDESENLHKITKQSGDRELANHVLLMQFVGFVRITVTVFVHCRLNKETMGE